MAEPIRLRALSISELVDEAVEIYRRRFMVFAAVSLALTIPPLATALLSGSYRSLDPFVSLIQSGISGPAVVAQPQYNGLFIGLSYVVGLVMAPLSGWSFAASPALVAVAISVAHGRDAGIGAALGAALKRYWALLGLMIIFGFAGVLFCVFPLALWIFTAWAVAVPALLEERASLGGALSRSWNLVQGNWWHSFWILTLAAGLGFVVEISLGAVFGLAAFLVPGLSTDARDALIVVASSIAGVATKPLIPIACTLLYYELRVRHEALDLDQLAATVSPAPALAGG